MQNDFEIGHFIDVKHINGEWYIAKIIDKDTEFIKIRYDGIKYETTLKMTSNKIAAFRKYTRGYTGNQKNCWRNDNDFTIENLMKYTDYLSNSDTFLKILDANMINQILRGNIFIHLDHFLIKLEEYNDDQMIMILKFIDAYILFSIEYLKYFPNLFQAFLDGMNNPENIITKREVALAYSIFEILESLGNLFGLNKRRIFHLANTYNKQDKQGYNILSTKCLFAINLSNLILPNNYNTVDQEEAYNQHDFEINIINTFGKYGGFIAIANLITSMYYPSSSSFLLIDDEDVLYNHGNKNLINQGIFLHMILYKEIISILSELSCRFAEKFAKLYAIDIEKKLKIRMSVINDKEIKDIDFDLIKWILLDHEKFFGNALQSDLKYIGSITENIELDILYKFLEYPSFERKLKAINGLKDFQSRIAITQGKYNNKINENGNDLDYNLNTNTNNNTLGKRYYNAELYIEWLIRMNIIRLIYEKYNHIELLKRSLDILKYIGLNMTMPIEIIDIICDNIKEKNEDIVLTIYNNIIELIPYLNKTLLQYIYNKFVMLKVDEYDKNFILFIGNLTLNSLDIMFPDNDIQQQMDIISKKVGITCYYNDEFIQEGQESIIELHKKDIESQDIIVIDDGEQHDVFRKFYDEYNLEDKLLGIAFLYEAILDNNVHIVTRELLDISLEFLIKIVTKKPYVILYTNILKNCFENLRKNISIYQSLFLIQGLFEIFDKNCNKFRPLTKLYFHKSFEEYDLIKLIINCCVKYYHLIKQKFQTLTLKNGNDTDPKKKEILKENNQRDMKYITTITTGTITGAASSAISNIMDKNYEEYEIYQNYEFFGKFPHKQNITKQIQAINFFLKNSFIDEVELQNNDIDILWDIFVINPNFSFERKEFLELISKIYTNDQGEDVILFNDNNSQYLFYSVICEPKKFIPEDITLEKFNCFDFYFKFTNCLEKKLKCEGSFDNCIVIDHPLINESTLWNYFLQCKNEDISYNFANVLVKIYVNFGEELYNQQIQIISDLLNDIMLNISKATKTNGNTLETKRYLQFLTKLFAYYEKKDFNWEKIHQAISPKFKTFISCNELGITMLELEFSINDKVGTFYEKLGSFFRLEHDEFVLIIDDSTKLTWSDCNANMKAYCIDGKINIELHEPEWIKRKAHPKYMFSQNIDHICSLFEILSNISLSDDNGDNYIWEFIRMLPLNNQLKENLEKTGMFNDLPWEIDSINNRNIHKFLYLLIIIQNLSVKYPYFCVDNKKFYEINSRSQWSNKFGSNGFRNLISILLNTDLVNLSQNKIIITTLCQLMKLIKFYYHGVLDEIIKIKDDMFLVKILDIIQYSIIYYIKTQNTSRCTANLKYEILLIFTTSSEVIQDFILNNIESIKTIINYERFGDISASYLLKVDLDNLKFEYFTFIRDILRLCSIKNLDYTIDLSNFKDKIMGLFFGDLLVQALHSNKSTIKFFSFLAILLNNHADQQKADQNHIMLDLIQYLKGINSMNITMLEEEKIQGILHLLNIFLNNFPEYIKIYGQDYGLTKEVLVNCIFKMPYDNDSIGPKLKYNIATKCAFQLLETLARNLDNLMVIINYLHPLFLKSKWRNSKLSKWKISAMDKRRTSNYVGLINMGCTCYLNSLIQQMYMIPSFRALLLKVNDPKFDTIPLEDNMLYQLKRLFHYLLNIQKDYHNPKKFALSIKDFDGNPTNFNEQKDVFEFFSLFMDQIEERIKKTKDENLIKFHFGGIFSNELICKDCPHHYEIEEPFLAINLSIKNKKNILNSLDSFISSEILEGDNAYFCEKCNSKVKAIKRISIKKLPNYLILVLKRFEYDFDREIKLKMNDYCEFPLELNMKAYTAQHIKDQETNPKKSSTIDSNTTTTNFKTIDDKDDFIYSLKGVIIHLGFADSGHYYSIIKDNQGGENVWYEFNDNKIKNFNINDLPNIGYGNKNINGNINLQNAYILIYEKKTINLPGLLNKYKLIQEDVVSRYIKEIYEQEKTNKAKEDMVINNIEIIPRENSENIKKHEGNMNMEKIRDEFLKNNIKEIHAFEELQIEIKEKNIKYFLIKNIFTNEFSDFIYTTLYNSDIILNKQMDNVLIQGSLIANPEFLRITKNIENQIFEFGVIIYYTTIIRMHNLQEQGRYCVWISKKIENDQKYARYFLNLHLNFPFFLEILMEFPITFLNSNVQNLNINLLKKSIRLVYEEEKKTLKDLFELNSNLYPISITVNLINFLISFLYITKNYIKNVNTYFHLLYHLIQCGKDLVIYLLKANMIGRIMEYIYEYYPNNNNNNVNDKENIKYKTLNNINNYRYTFIHNDLSFDNVLININNHSKNIEDLSKYELTYMWKVLEYLILSCDLTPLHSKYIYKKHGIDFGLNLQEIYKFTLKYEYIRYTVLIMGNRSTIKSIAKIYGYLCYENQEASIIVLKFLIEILRDKEARISWQLFKFIKYMCRINDKYQENRVKYIVDNIFTYFNLKEENLVTINILSNYIKKMIINNLIFRDKISESKHILVILQWLEKNFGLSNNKEKDSKMENTQLKEFKKNARELYDFFNNFVENPNNIPSKDELNKQNEKYSIDISSIKPGMLVDYCITPDSWITAQVEHTIEDLVKIKFLDQKIGEWIDIRSDLIYPHKSKQQQQQHIINEIREIEDSETEYITTNEPSDKEDDGGNSGNLSNNFMQTSFPA